MVKLQTRVPKKLADVIARVQIDRDLKKGKAMSILLELALSNSDFEVLDFGDGDVANCTLEVSDKDYEAAKPYRERHTLTSRSGYFRDALARGASVYEHRNPKADQV